MRSRDLAVFSCLFFILASAFAWVCRLHRTPPLSADFFFSVQPAQHLATEMAQRGEAPLWNPYSNCGAPLLAGLREGLLYPPLLVLRFLGTLLGAQVFLWLHHFLAGLFALLCARGLGLARPSAALAALVTAFNGFFFYHQPYLNQFAGIAWLPAVTLLRPRASAMTASHLSASALALAFQFLTGNPFFLYASMLAALFAESAALARRRTGRAGGLLRLGRNWAACGALALVFSSAQLVPFLELLRISARGATLSFESATVFSEPPLQMARFLLVPLWSWFQPETESDPSITGFYVGLTVLSLSLIAVRRARPARPWFFACLCALLLSFGSYLPGYRWLWEVLPGMKLFRFPAQWLFLPAFLMALLAGEGLRGSGPRLRAWALVFVCAELFLFAARSPFGRARAGFFRARLPGTESLQAAGRRISHVREGHGLGKEYLGSAEDWALARAALLPDISIPYRIASASGYGAAETAWKERLSARLFAQPGGFDLWSFASAAPFQLRYKAESGTVGQTPALPRSFWTDAARFMGGDAPVLEEMDRLASARVAQALVSSGDPGSAPGPKLAAAVRTLDVSERRLRTLLPGNLGAGWVFLADSYDPGWKAYAGGREVPVLRANYAFRAVPVPAGAACVVWLYRPAGFSAGLVLSLASGLGGAFLAWNRLKRAARGVPA